MTVSEILESLRKERGMTVAELARRADICYDTVSNTLKGSSMMRGDYLIRMCHVLGLEISDFNNASNSNPSKAA